MTSPTARVDALQRSRVGLFFKKLMDDQAPNLAALLAWGTLNALLPLLLGILSLVGLVLRDPQRVNDVYNALLTLLPGDVAAPVREALDGVRQTAAAPAGIVAFVLLLFNGSSLFANMESVFDQAYHVETRNVVMQRLTAIVMLIITSVLLVISTLAAGIGTLIGNVPIGLPIGPALGRTVSFSISILSAFLLFLLIYKVLPNTKQDWRDVLPGAMLSSVLFFVISLIFPLYVNLFPPNQAYALFGVFLVLLFWLYLLGFVFVLGAEVNAFLLEPARSTALATHDSGQSSSSNQSECLLEGASSRPSLAGRLLGFVGLVIAALLLRGRTAETSDKRATA